MKKKLGMQRWTIVGVLMGTVALSGCAVQYQTRTNRASDYNHRIERLFVWSAIGEARPLRDQKYGGDTYENHFHAALKRALTDAGIVADVRRFSPKNDTPDDLNRFESQMNPATRLLIVPQKYNTFTYVTTFVQQLWLDLSLIERGNNRRVWRGEIYIDSSNTGAALAWDADSAEDLARTIISALKKDGLIAP